MSEDMIKKFKSGSKIVDMYGTEISFIYDASDNICNQYVVECTKDSLNDILVLGRKWMATECSLKSNFKLPKRKVWVNFYTCATVVDCIRHFNYPSEEDAKRHATTSATSTYVCTAEVEVDDN